jgi:Uma2 family endonuclease
VPLGALTMSRFTPTQPAPTLSGSGQRPGGGTPTSSTWRQADLDRMTVDEYERIGGMLDDDRVELIDGYLVKKMGKNPPHIWSVTTTLKILAGLLPPEWTWRKEDPIRIPEFDEPEPDLAVVRGSDDDCKVRIPVPADVALVIESSETTLAHDQGPKLLAYARGAIPVYSIINLVDNRVEVYTNPSLDGYQSRVDFKPGQDVPVVIDGVAIGRIAVTAVLP